jgi:flavin-dependent dehydrogenase
MHLRSGHYIGVAPLPGGLANAILVLPLPAMREAGTPPARLLDRALGNDPLLADRFAGARALGPPVILGPMAMDVRAPSHPGLLLAGDAAGFIDPMTGDGMRFAIAGGILAARAALAALTHGWPEAEARLARERRRAFRRKHRFNRALRCLTTMPTAVSAAACCATLAEPVLVRLVAYAGDTSAPVIAYPAA